MSEETVEQQMERIARLEVQAGFAHYLTEIFPEQLERIIAAHNCDVTAHVEQIQNAVKTESARMKLWLYGLIFAGGIGGGVGLHRAITALL